MNASDNEYGVSISITHADLVRLPRSTMDALKRFLAEYRKFINGETVNDSSSLPYMELFEVASIPLPAGSKDCSPFNKVIKTPGGYVYYKYNRETNQVENIIFCPEKT